MTPDAAYKKYCPYMTYCVNDQASYEAHFGVYVQATCHANDCMAWVGSVNDGYCGLAGHPNDFVRSVIAAAKEGGKP